MNIFESQNKFRTTIEEREKEIIIEEKKLAEDKEMYRESLMSKEEKEKKKQEKEACRRKIITEVFKECTEREMTEEEYQEYISVFNNSEEGFNLWSWIEKHEATNNTAVSH